MKKLALLTLILVLLLVVAATATADSSKVWMSHFTYEVPGGTWSDGANVEYRFHFTYTYPFEGGTLSAPSSFAVSDEAALYPGTVVFRSANMAWAQVESENGRDCRQLEPPFTINPSQSVLFHIGWRTDQAFTPAEARAHFDSMIARVDYGAGYMVMEAHEIVPYLDAVYNNYWDNRICSYTH